jgi:hypothetical protein
MGSCRRLPPSREFNWHLRHGNGALTQPISPLHYFQMARLVVLVIDPCMRSAGLLPSQRRLDLARPLWTAVVPVTLLHLWFDIVPASPPERMRSGQGEDRGGALPGSPVDPRSRLQIHLPPVHPPVFRLSPPSPPRHLHSVCFLIPWPLSLGCRPHF